jgi:hypothetical protein
MIILNHESHSYMLNTLPGELIHETYNRLWKIIQHKPTSDHMYEQLVKISQLWHYKKKYGCAYSKSMEILIELF